MGRFYSTLDGDIPLTPSEELEADQLEAAWIAGQLDRDKESKIDLIKANSNLSAPVTINSVTYNGGESSASAIMGGIDLAKFNQEITIDIWDINDDVATYSIVDAMYIANTIGLAYRTAALARQIKIMAVNDIIIDANGTYPTYESAKAALDLITP